MTKLDGQISLSKSRLATAAVKTNLQAKDYPYLAAKAYKDAEFYANWLNENGQQVEMDTVEENGLRRVLNLTVNGAVYLKNGAYAYTGE